MARITYSDRFEALLAKDYIIKRDRQFLESLYTYYKSNRVLTSGRRHHFLRLENQYRNPPAVATEDKELIKELNTLISKLDYAKDERGQEILGSFGEQLRAGKSLSPRQMAIVEEKRDACSEKNITQAQQWEHTWNSEKAERFNICVKYYGKTGYFRNIVIKAQNKDYIPSFSEYKKLTENKYARGILRGWFAKAKYEPGTLVVPSSYGSWNARHITLGMILQSNPHVPTSYGKGNKVYHVIDLPTNKKHFIQERHLKFAKLPKKKTK